jgi:glycosyltransferase involved in cell wall biosynthesis
MRVAILSPLFESVPPRLYGGTERVIANLCRGLTDSDVEVTLFATGDSSIDGRIVPVVPEGLRLSSAPDAQAHAHSLRMISLVSRQADEFDLIHNHHDCWKLPLSKMVATPMLTTLHGRLDVPALASAYLSYPGSRYVSISDSQRAPLPGLPWLRTIHHGLALEEIRFRPKPGRYLAFLGRMSPEKRPDWAVEVARRSGVPLKMAAKIEGKESREYYDQRVRPHVDGRFIEYVGEISEDEKRDFLGEALGLVFPIDWPEPFGLVVIESLASGTPVLARPCGAMPELLADGITGFCHADVRELARRVPDLAGLDRRRCRSWVEERFSLRRMTEDYLDVYRRISGEPVGRRAAGDRRHLLYPV